MSNSYKNTRQGFSLVEVMIVLAVIGIVTAIAAPSFVGTTQKFRVLGESNALMGTMTFARSEAIKRGTPVTMCASADGTTCLTTPTWHQGWIVFDPATGSPTPQLLKVQSALRGTDTITADNSTTSLTFGRDGFTVGLPAVTVLFSIRTTPTNASVTHCVEVSRTGRLQTIAAVTSPTCT